MAWLWLLELRGLPAGDLCFSLLSFDQFKVLLFDLWLVFLEKLFTVISQLSRCESTHLFAERLFWVVSEKVVMVGVRLFAASHHVVLILFVCGINRAHLLDCLILDRSLLIDSLSMKLWALASNPSGIPCSRRTHLFARTTNTWHGICTHWRVRLVHVDWDSAHIVHARL